MANEIQYTWSLTVSKKSSNIPLVLNYGVSGKTATMTGTHVHDTVQDIGTTHEAMVIPADVGTKGWGYLVNLDTTNYVEVGVDVAATFYPVVRVDADSEQPIRWAEGATLYARANTATVKLRFVVIEK